MHGSRRNHEDPIGKQQAAHVPEIDQVTIQVLLEQHRNVGVDHLDSQLIAHDADHTQDLMYIRSRQLQGVAQYRPRPSSG